MKSFGLCKEDEQVQKKWRRKSEVSRLTMADQEMTVKLAEYVCMCVSHTIN